MINNKLTKVLVTIFILISMFSTSFADVAETWSSITAEMVVVLDDAYAIYETGDIDKAKKRVNDAYFNFYEVKGVERTVLSYISGNRVRSVEAKFANVKRLMKKGKPASEVKAEIETLKEMVILDANILDGNIDKETHQPIQREAGAKNKAGASSDASIFSLSLTIIVREGAEAILIVAAILAFLTKTKQKSLSKSVYIGVVLALIASVVMAVLIAKIPSLGGVNQEIFEGVTMIIAVLMLFYVGSWFQKKSDMSAWSQYIENKVDDSVAKGSAFSLAFTSFLAVFREGAELIIMYQSLKGSWTAKWSGFVVGLLILVVVYIAVRYLSLKLPLKPFFMATSVLIYIMAIIFVGNAVFEFAEADVVNLTQIPLLPSEFKIYWLGLYPYFETLLPQIVAVVIALVLSIRQYKQCKKLNS